MPTPFEYVSFLNKDMLKLYIEFYGSIKRVETLNVEECKFGL